MDASSGGSYSWHDQFEAGRLDTGDEEEVPVGCGKARCTDREGDVLAATGLDQRGALQQGTHVLGGGSRRNGEVDGEATCLVGVVGEDDVVGVRPAAA